MRKAALTTLASLALTGSTGVITSRVLFHAAAGAVAGSGRGAAGTRKTSTVPLLGDEAVQHASSRVLELALKHQVWAV